MAGATYGDQAGFRSKQEQERPPISLIDLPEHEYEQHENKTCQEARGLDHDYLRCSIEKCG